MKNKYLNFKNKARQYFSELQEKKREREKPKNWLNYVLKDFYVNSILVVINTIILIVLFSLGFFDVEKQSTPLRYFSLFLVCLIGINSGYITYRAFKFVYNFKKTKKAYYEIVKGEKNEDKQETNTKTAIK